jgi:hypothetical protein
MTTAIISTALITGIVFMWFYLPFFLSSRQRAADMARMEVIVAQLRQKYCAGEPYEIEAIREFCAQSER